MAGTNKLNLEAAAGKGSLAAVEQEMRKCMKCGNCRAVCPVFREIGTESGVARGKIRLAEALLSEELEANPEVAKRLDLCLACKACAVNCPSGVKFESIILAAREEIAKRKKTSLAVKPWKSPVIFRVTSNRRLFHAMLRLAGKIQRPLLKGQSTLRHLPLALSELTSFRTLPVISDKPFRDWVREYLQEVKNPKGRVLFYSGCAIDFAYPNVGSSLVKVLNRRGYEVVYPQEQGCCGTPLRYMGDIKPVLEMARANISALERALQDTGADYIVTACPTCTGAWVHDYPSLFAGEPEWLGRAKAVSGKMKEFTCFITAEYSEEAYKGTAGSRSEGVPRRDATRTRVTYHDSCHMKRHLGIYNEPRQLLIQADGLEYVEMSQADACCGCGGSFSLKFPEVSAGILTKKLENIDMTGADLVVTGCPGCLLQLKGGLEKSGKKARAMHIAEIMDAFGDRCDK